MRRCTRDAVARLLFLLAEHDLHERHCACRRCIDRPLTPAIRAQIDAVQVALVDEPDTGRFGYIEYDGDKQ